jgi:hypothetical protein
MHSSMKKLTERVNCLETRQQRARGVSGVRCLRHFISAEGDEWPRDPYEDDPDVPPIDAHPTSIRYRMFGPGAGMVRFSPYTGPQTNGASS